MNIKKSFHSNIHVQSSSDFPESKSESSFLLLHLTRPWSPFEPFSPDSSPHTHCVCVCVCVSVLFSLNSGRNAACMSGLILPLPSCSLQSDPPINHSELTLRVKTPSSNSRVREDRQTWAQLQPLNLSHRRGWELKLNLIFQQQTHKQTERYKTTHK